MALPPMNAFVHGRNITAKAHFCQWLSPENGVLYKKISHLLLTNGEKERIVRRIKGKDASEGYF